MSQARWPQLFSSQTPVWSLAFADSMVTRVESSLTEDFLIKLIVLCPAETGGLKEMMRREVALCACRNLCCLFSLLIP